jgi:hypothetical protein
MKHKITTFSIFLILGTLLASCSHQKPTTTDSTDRSLASDKCKVKGEYHSYFEEVEKCLEMPQK